VLLNPGVAIQPDDFRGAVSTSGEVTDAEKLARFSMLVDYAPRLSALYNPGNRVSTLYNNFLQGAKFTNTRKPTKEEEEEYAEAKALLYDEVPVEGDPKKPPRKPRVVPTEDYVAYQDATKAYTDAISDLNTAKWEENLNPREWQVKGPKLLAGARSAYEDLKRSGASGIQTALETFNRFKMKSQVLITADAQARFNASAIADKTGNPFHPVWSFPSTWMEINERTSDQWTLISIDNVSSKTDEKSDIHKGGGKGGLTGIPVASIGGVIKADGTVDVNYEKVALHTDLSKMKIAFRYLRVELRRPWLDVGLLGLNGVYMEGIRRGGYSDGKRDSVAEQLQLPLVPTSMILARDVRISVNWDRRDLDNFVLGIKAGGNVTIGPFSIGGEYAGERRDKVEELKSVTTELKMDGISLIGFLCQIAPLCPTADGNSGG
jgi:hypothetical protein